MANGSIYFTNTGVSIGGTTANVTLDLAGASDAIAVPVGNTTQRPTGNAGYIRYNSDTLSFEGFTSAWGAIGGGSLTVQNNNTLVNTTTKINFSNGANVLLKVIDDYANNRINVNIDSLNSGGGGGGAAVYANGTLVLANTNTNYNNTVTVNVSAIANGSSNTNVAFNANVSAIAGPAYAQANNAYGVANLAYGAANTAAGEPIGTAAYVAANAAYGQANAAYGTANTASTGVGNAYAEANAAYTQANSAFAAANGAQTYASGTVLPVATNAYNTANTAFNQANNSYNEANLAYTAANSAQTQANTIYATVNTSYSVANNAYNTANLAYSAANSAQTQANTVYAQANNSYAQANLAYTAANSAQTSANVGVGGAANALLAYAQANAAYTLANTANNTANQAYFYANTVAAGSATAAYNQANAAYLAANSAQTQANVVYAQANAAYGQANLAYTRANLAVINVSSGNVSNIVISGNASNVIIDTRLVSSGSGGLSGYAGGTQKFVTQNTVLGNVSATSTNVYPINITANSGYVSNLAITSNVGSSYDLLITGGNNSSNVFFAAYGLTGNVNIGSIFFYNSDNVFDNNLYVSITNYSVGGVISYTLRELRVEALPQGLAGNGSGKVYANNISLGSVNANANISSTYTFFDVPNIGGRGLISYFNVTSNINTTFDIIVTGTNGNTGNLFLAANGVTGNSYSHGAVFYYENDSYYANTAAYDMYIGIKNYGNTNVAFTLANVRMEAMGGSAPSGNSPGTGIAVVSTSGANVTVPTLTSTDNLVYTQTNFVSRGLINGLVITPNNAGAVWDLQISGANNGGNVYVQANSITGTYSSNVVTYYENDSGNTSNVMYIGIRNYTAANVLFTVTSLTGETFLANAQFAYANNAYLEANLAYAQANAALAYAISEPIGNLAYSQANNAYAAANTALGASAAAAYNQANNAYNQANNSYTTANSAQTIAQNVYARVNAFSVFANSGFILGNVINIAVYNTATINVSATSNTSDGVNLSFTVNTAAIKNVVSLNVSSNIANTGNLSVTQNTVTGNLKVTTLFNVATANISSLALVANGTVTAPSLAFGAQTNTGLYLITTSTLGLTANGNLVANFAQSSITFYSANINTPSAVLTNTATRVVTGTVGLKKSSTSCTSSTVLTTDNTLSITLDAGAYYEFEYYLTFYGTSNGAGGISFDMGGGTAGIITTCSYQPYAGYGTSQLTSISTAITSVSSLQSVVPIGTSSSTPSYILGKGTLFTVTGGTFAIRWAQSVSSANATNLAAPSYLKATKIG